MKSILKIASVALPVLLLTSCFKTMAPVSDATIPTNSTLYLKPPAATEPATSPTDTTLTPAPAAAAPQAVSNVIPVGKSNTMTNPEALPKLKKKVIPPEDATPSTDGVLSKPNTQ